MFFYSRYTSREDSCHLLVGLVHAATSKSPGARKASQAYINKTSLRNCSDYANGGLFP